MKNSSVFSTIIVIHQAMLLGQVIFMAIMFYLVYSRQMKPGFPEYEKMLQGIALLFTVLAIFVGTNLFKKRLLAINENPGSDARTKLTRYRSAAMLQWGLMEAACLICGMSLLLTGNYAFVALALVLIVYFALLTPAKTKVAAQLNLQTSDLDVL